MMNVLVTGSAGFVGRNLCSVLRERGGVRVFEHDLGSPGDALAEGLATADVVFHLAGVNRPQDPSEFRTGNTDSTVEICERLQALGRGPKIVLTSSIQADLDNPYGQSKRAAEDALREYSEQTGGTAVVHRLKNLFGKWCRPNYNSVTATFCYNIAHDLPVQINNPSHEVDLTFIGDVMTAFVAELNDAHTSEGFLIAEPLPSRQITLGDLAALIASFRASRTTLLVPDFSSGFVRALYATYLSYLETKDFAYRLDVKADPRGTLAEFVKSPPFGQIFVSRTVPGITRGNHYHHVKTEKFFVVEGDAIIRFRSVRSDGDVIEYRVSGRDYRVVDIPPGYTHSIENVGTGELVTLFWASEIFDKGSADTHPLNVQLEKQRS